MRETSAVFNIIFILLEWITFALWIILTLKYVARKSKVKPINDFFRKIHIPLGIVLAVTMVAHGVLAWIEYPQDISTNVTGLVLAMAFVLLTLSFVLRKKLKKKWFVIHRVVSFLSILLLIAHIVLANVL